MAYQKDQISDQRCQVVRCYGVSKTSASFRYKLKRICDVLIWSVLLRYQLIPRNNVTNWSGLFLYQRDVTKMFHIGPSNSFISCDVIMMSQHDPGHSNQSLNWTNFLGVLCSTLPQRLRWFSLFKVPASTLLQRLKDVGLIQVPVVTSVRGVKLVGLTQVSFGTSLRRL